MNFEFFRPFACRLQQIRETIALWSAADILGGEAEPRQCVFQEFRCLSEGFLCVSVSGYRSGIGLVVSDVSEIYGQLFEFGLEIEAALVVYLGVDVDVRQTRNIAVAWGAVWEW